MAKLKSNFVLAMQRLVSRLLDRRDVHVAVASQADAATVPRHPLLGALKGLLRVMPGTDLTKPADPDWGKV